MDIEKTNIDIYSSVENKNMGKVNFNTAFTNDYLTNEAFKILRTNLLFCGSDIKTVLITSSHENEGKSTVSAGLAKSLAETNKKTLLVDADMRKSVFLKKNLKTQNIFGLSEVLTKQATLNQAIYNTQIPDFDVIFSGRFPPNPVELLNSNIFTDVLNQLKSQYDYIIIDSPPLGMVIDAAVIANNCDGTVLVIAVGNTTKNEVDEVKNQLEKSNCRILGTVLNELNPKFKSKYSKGGYYNRPYGNSKK